MYNKIMPSLSSNTDGEDVVEPITSLTNTVRRIQSPEDTFIIRNFMEDVLLEKMDHTMKMLRACTCERCKKDVMALCLNELPPSYSVLEGDVEASVKKLRSQFEVKVTSVLIKSIQTVKSKPQHE